ALGVVLYEMTTGARPFRGDSQASLIASILREEPAPLRMRQPLTPLAFDRVVRRCLAKDPDDRWQTGRDLAAELAWIRDTIYERAAQGSPAAISRRSLVFVRGSVAGFAVLLTAMLPVMRKPVASLPSFHQITFRQGVITSARFAPDGQSIVYSASWQGQPYHLYLTRAESHESRDLGISDARLFGISV